MWKDKYNPDIIEYGNSNEVTKVLFLFNIALTQIAEKDSFFPFHRFYNVKSWNIEHILAKNDDGLKEMSEFENYLSVVEKLMQNAKDDSSQNVLTEESFQIIIALCEELDECIKNNKISQCRKKVKRN